MQIFKPILLGLFFFDFVNAGFLSAQMVLHSDFENGNGILTYQSKTRNSLAFMPVAKNRDTEAVWFYFRLTGFRKDTVLTLHLPFQRASYAPDPLIVRDGKQVHRIPSENQPFFKSYRYLPASDTLFISTGPHYTYSDLQAFLTNLSSKNTVQISSLCQSEEGRNVPLVIIRNPKQTPQKTIFILARQHAFESPSSFFVQGIMEELTKTGGNLEAGHLSEFQFLIVPMMDVDNVWHGAYGKDQKPKDFNRDWAENSHWNAVLAVKSLLRKVEKEAPISAIFDLHAPHPITQSFSHYYLGAVDSAKVTQNLKRFMAIHQNKEGYKMHSQRNNRIKPGELNFNRYVLECKENQNPCFPHLEFSTTYEQSWQQKPDGTPYTSETILQSGSNLVKSLGEYFGKR